MAVTKKLKQQIRSDFENIVTYANEFWKLRQSLDTALDDFEATLEQANLIEPHKDGAQNDDI
jgi:hypothetical protein